MNILFTPSDNNRASGAFLSMVALAALLQRRHGHRVLVALPYQGDGAELLQREGIRSVLVPSYTWTARLADMRRPGPVLKDAVKAAITRTSVPRLARIIRAEHIDLVHVNTTWGHVGALGRAA